MLCQLLGKFRAFQESFGYTQPVAGGIRSPQDRIEFRGQIDRQQRYQRSGSEELFSS